MPFLLANWKWFALAAAVLALVVSALVYVERVRSEGKKAGAAEVTNAVQTETIKQTEKARQEKVETDEKIRNTPIDELIDRSLR